VLIGDEILEPDEMAGLADHPVLEAEQDAIDERIADQRREEQERQRHHQPAEHVLAIEPAGQRGGTARRPRPAGQREAADRHAKAREKTQAAR
jgi:hypothetical protein